MYQLVKKFDLGDVYFPKNINVFRYLELEIALAILASDDEIYK